jgi:hypothetical protein
MNADRDTLRTIGAWLREETHENGDRVLDAVVELIDSTPQRRHGWRGRRTRLMNTRLGLGLAAAALIAAVAFTLTNLPANNSGVGTSPLPSPSPAATGLPTPSRAAAADLDVGVAIVGGTYTLSVGKSTPAFRFDVTLPAGWVPQKLAESEVAFAGAARPPYSFIGFYTLMRIYKDPCHPEVGYQGDYLGHSNALDAVAEIRSLEDFEATTPTTVMVGGYEARTFVLSNTIDTDAAGCTAGGLLPLFATDDAPDRTTEPQDLEFSPATNGGTTQHIWVVNRDLWPLLIVGETDETSSESQLEILQEVVDSIMFR